MITNAPGARSQTNLEQGVTVEQDDDGDEETEGEGVVGGCFVGFVEGVGFGEFLLVVFEGGLLGGGEDGEFICFGVGWEGWRRGFFGVRRGRGGGREGGGKVGFVFEFWEGLFAAEAPG